ncbi:hypothetical protein [Microbacterium sp. HSID17254]|uniref:hypothetical protein n=1 Tax=Microbacterium sp. HSID17254 TaxID=2419509 RepID=UPI000F885BFB|nr:hypothetical protein [Microbacterium sp. HSID17254]
MTRDVMDELSAIDLKRSVILRKLEEMRGELKELEAERDRLCDGVDLPTEPGWYLTADETPARLSEDGTWDDGWGNSGPDYGPAWHPQPLKRLIVATESENP